LWREIIAGVFGGSRVQVSGPTGAFIVILAGITARYERSDSQARSVIIMVGEKR
jgi:MFS superfamily sulfate permease-like transporter